MSRKELHTWMVNNWWKGLTCKRRRGKKNRIHKKKTLTHTWYFSPKFWAFFRSDFLLNGNNSYFETEVENWDEYLAMSWLVLTVPPNDDTKCLMSSTSSMSASLALVFKLRLRIWSISSLEDSPSTDDFPLPNFFLENKTARVESAQPFN